MPPGACAHGGAGSRSRRERAGPVSLAGARAVQGSDAEAAAWLRTEMGRELAARRRAAGLSQQRLAELTGSYSRSVVAHAENGRDDVGGGFWRAADRLLGAGGLFAGLDEEMRVCLEPARQATFRAGDSGQEVRCGAVLRSAEPDRALAAYRRLGWPVAAGGDLVELLAGRTADVLEVGRAAGMVAAGAWLETARGEGTARAVPRLPAPEGTLAVIEAGDRWFFLVRTGFPVPWVTGDRGAAAAAAEADVRWHSAGGRVALPPSKAGRVAARWAYLPQALLRPAPPLAVLDLLGWAVAVTRAPGRLLLPGGAAVAAAVPGPHGRPVLPASAATGIRRAASQTPRLASAGTGRSQQCRANRHAARQRQIAVPGLSVWPGRS